MSFCRIGKADLWEGEMIHVSVGKAKILVVNVGGQIHAFEDVCPHLGARLSDGSLMNGVIHCPLHDWQFSAQTGSGINPESTKLKSYPVEIRVDEIWANIPGEDDEHRS